MKYDRSEAVRYMGGRAGDENAGVLADLAYLKLRNEVQARSVYRVLDCSVDADGVLLGGEYFKSAKLAAHIKGCKRAVLLAATLGSKVDIALRRMAVANIAEGAAGQAVCAALIESYCDETEAKISNEYGGLHFKLAGRAQTHRADSNGGRHAGAGKIGNGCHRHYGRVRKAAKQLRNLRKYELPL